MLRDIVSRETWNANFRSYLKIASIFFAFYACLSFALCFTWNSRGAYFIALRGSDTLPAFLAFSLLCLCNILRLFAVLDNGTRVVALRVFRSYVFSRFLTCRTFRLLFRAFCNSAGYLQDFRLYPIGKMFFPAKSFYLWFLSAKL